MELIVVAGVAVVIYCGYVTILEELRSALTARAGVSAAEKRAVKRRRPAYAAHGRGGVVAGHWPAHAKGSA